MQAPNPRLNEVFFALSDPTRRAIVDRLAQGPSTIGELAEPFSISAPAITKHVKVLERAGLVSRRIEGRRHHCSLDPKALWEAQEWIAFYREFWEARLDELEKLLKTTGDDTNRDPNSETTN